MTPRRLATADDGAKTPEAISKILGASLDHLTDAVLLTQGETTKGPDGVRRILFVNEAYVQMTGFSRAEAIGETPGITIGPGSDRAVLSELERARAELRPIRVELLKYKKDGTTFWTELDVVPLFDERGRNSHFLGVLRDVTEQRLLLARLQQTDRLASLGTLAAGIAHEINNPLSYVLMNLTDAIAQLGEDAPPDLRASLAEAVEGAERVRRIVRDISMFSRDGRGRDAPIEIAPVLDSAIQMARAELTRRGRIIRDYHAAPHVLGDPTRLGQVFLNLLLNAAHALRDGDPARNEVRASIFVKDSGLGGAPGTTNVCVQIEDTGPGIPPEILPRVFEPFFTTKAIGEGSGLGLSICHGIVTSLGGTIEIFAGKPRGTIVRVSLPTAGPRELR